MPFNLGGSVCFSELVLWWGSDSVVCVFQIIIPLSGVAWLWLDPMSVGGSSLALLVCTCSRAAFRCLPASFSPAPARLLIVVQERHVPVFVCLSVMAATLSRLAAIRNVQNDWGEH